MNSVLTALRVFEEVAAAQPVGLSELSNRLDVPKSTVQRCLKTLADAGWLRPAINDAGRWVITGKAFSLGSALSAGDDLRDVALPELSRLQAETGETVHLAVPDGNELVLVERLDSAHQLRAFLPLGTRLPLHAASNGKAYLASLSDAEIEEFLAAELTPVTGRTVTDPAALGAELAEIRRRGYAVTDQELHDGIAAVAVALRGRGGAVRGCFSVSGPASRLTPDLYREYGERALASRAAIERFLS
ncbi:IclR family transcriptional regulator [Rhodococcus sp. ABRD24]|uniref:IclR family transcriptional regulator n=1 Tax=Rhodococcus sp. ABRD24 TaxID=2507582 RepID=UPI0010388FDC|nr:IclR family transcriptional regulator [Rhodococcus sp. ABRD24]QBJ96583.1 IclR family transcriptional regulator [Rhodococcus sp. ABRD24]